MNDTEETKDIQNVEDEARGQEDKTAAQLTEAIREQATEEDSPQSAGYTLRKILGGDFLTAEVMRRQIGVIILIAFMTMIYVSNRYSCQQDLLEIVKLEKELTDAKYKALASSSELTEMCRESNVLEMLKNNKDSVLKIPNQPPYIINVPDNE